jgi:hypothetical protein
LNLLEQHLKIIKNITKSLNLLKQHFKSIKNIATSLNLLKQHLKNMIKEHNQNFKNVKRRPKFHLQWWSFKFKVSKMRRKMKITYKNYRTLNVNF